MISQNGFLGREISLDLKDPIYVAGHEGMAGNAIWRYLKSKGHTSLLGKPRLELDLTNRHGVFEFFERHRPKHVVLAAAKVGGIYANNSEPVDFLSSNLQIQTNVMDAALAYDVDRLVFLGSSCAYPKDSPQPIREEYLLTGSLEPTNEAYAVAKIAGIKLVQAVRRQYKRRWISVMPTNLYGPRDNYRERESHVLAALITRIANAKLNDLPSVTHWGSGSPLRELLHVDDMAAQIYDLMTWYDDDLPVNIGSGYEFSIRELSDIVRQELDYKGEVHWDGRLEGVPRKKLHSRADIPQESKLRQHVRDSFQDFEDRHLASKKPGVF